MKNKTTGIHTLNGRFVVLIVIVVIAILILSLYSHQVVRRSSSQSLVYIQANQDLSASINTYKTILQQTESALHQYSTFLSAEQKDKVFTNLDLLITQSASLKQLPSINLNAELHQDSLRLHDESIRLRDIIQQYIAIMQDVESRYPAMPILLTHLEPTNRKFSEAVELALQEGELTEFRPKVIERDHHRIIQLFQEARYAWSMQASWLRIFIANRMGAFGDPEKAMRSNLENRNMFAANVSETLDKLDEYNKKGLLGIQQEESLSQMHEALIYYNIYIEKAVTLYLSKNWRADAVMLRGTLQPALNNIWDTTKSIEYQIAEINNQGIFESQNTTYMLSNFIWLFTSAICVLLLIAFNVFQRKIRQPILQLANSMTNDDPLQNNIQVSEGNITEVNRLVSSYIKMRQQVLNRQNRLESILDTAAEGIITINDSGQIRSFNAAAQNLFGYKAEEIKGKGLSLITSHELENEFVSGEILKNKTKREITGIRKDGSLFLMSFKVSGLAVDDNCFYTAIIDDISERRAVMDHLRHLAEHDSLTGLHNRQFFNDSLERAFEQARRDGRNNCACVYIDLDNFKYVNDTLGHLEGDRLLIGIASTLKHRTRKSDILARLGGDEFALLIQNIDEEQLQIVADGYRQAIAAFSFIANGKHIDAGCSIGVALYEDDIETKDGLLARADIACHMAKRAGRNRVYVFRNEDKDRINSLYNEMGWSRRIRNALENDHFVFFCHPILDVNTEKVFSYELLLRMIDQDTGEQIMPSGFLDAADRFGLMGAIDTWVITHAFEWLNETHDDPGLNYFINLSGKSIGDDKLLATIKTLLPTLRIPSNHIVFEITEDVAIAELEKAKSFLAELHLLGFKTALDDFGVGYSSFSYLRELNVDYVKIDGSFINTMHTDKLNYALVKAINDICHILGKRTVAEFVQNTESIALLKNIGVDYAQGHNIVSVEDDNQHTIEFNLPSRRAGG